MNVDIFVCINFRKFAKIGNFALFCICDIISPILYNNNYFHGVHTIHDI